MSDVSVDIIKNRNGEAPDLPSGANLSGVSTAATLQVTNLNPTHINASGVTTATTFSGSLKSTGTPTLGLGVTINSSGINISGVATAGIVSATTLYGDGSNLTGVAMSIAPISYQPDVNDSLVSKTNVSIGITFTERVKAGSGNVTLRLVSAGGTVVENFGVGSSVTIANNTVLVTPTAALVQDTVYHISYPSGAFTNTAGDVSYVGTAYTFAAAPTEYQLWAWGGVSGAFGYNTNVTHSSPVQIPGSNWDYIAKGKNCSGALKDDATLWMWGSNSVGCLGQNQGPGQLGSQSSPIQVPGSWSALSIGQENVLAVKTNGTMWSWGNGSQGCLGQNEESQSYSSPTQIPGTTWSKVSLTETTGMASRTDGTLYGWGDGTYAVHAQNDRIARSSPTQIPGTNWRSFDLGEVSLGILASKTDGTLWAWGYNGRGNLGQNNRVYYSSPVQVGSETTWTANLANAYATVGAIKTDGTLWTWGGAQAEGQLGLNDRIMRSSPTQIPGTNWATIVFAQEMACASKTDGTLWAMGNNEKGGLGQNNLTQYSSPVQIPGTTWTTDQTQLDNQRQGINAIKIV